jgi:single-strand DNA-binding protein
MSSINVITLCGNVGADAEVKDINGTKVARFRIATSTGGYKKQDGTDVPERTEWHTVIAWRSLANLCEYIKKGNRVTVVGRLTYNEFEKDGVKRTLAEIQATNIVLDTKRESPNAEAMNAPLPEPPAEYNDDLPF